MDRNIRRTRLSGSNLNRIICLGGLSRFNTGGRGEGHQIETFFHLQPPLSSSTAPAVSLAYPVTPPPDLPLVGQIWCSSSPGIFSKLFLKWMRVTFILLNLGIGFSFKFMWNFWIVSWSRDCLSYSMYFANTRLASTCVDLILDLDSNLTFF